MTSYKSFVSMRYDENIIDNDLIYVVLYQTESSNDVDIDLDEVLDIEDENQRKEFIFVSYQSLLN